MKLCGVEAFNKPACERELDAAGMCPVHCRALVRACNVCEYRFTKEDGRVEACPQCTKDRHCSKYHIRGRVRCKYHGGRSCAGLSSPRLKHARCSRYLDVFAPRARRDYLKAQDGPDPLSLEEDINLLDMRVRELLAALQPERDLMGELRETFEEFAAAQEARDRGRSLAALQKLAGLIRDGDAEARSWREIDELAWKRRPRMVLAEVRRKIRVSELVPAATVVDAMRFMAGSLRRHVKDPVELENISADLARFGRGALAGTAGAVARACLTPGEEGGHPPDD